MTDAWLGPFFAFTEGMVELRACPDRRGGGRAPSIYTRDADDVGAFVRAWDRDGYGVFFGACTRRPDSTPPGRAETVWECPAPWLDNDTAPPEVVERALRDAYLPATAIVSSGRGIHGYWFLKEPVPAGERDRVVDLLRELRRTFSSDPAVCDVARIMRLPGTHNRKHGPPPRPVRVLHLSESRYTFDELADWLAWQQPLIGERPDPFLAAAERLGVRPAVDVARALATMAPGNVHDRQLRVSASLRAAGKTDEEIVTTLLAATRQAAGEEGRRWDWRREEAGLREMVRGAERKFGQVLSLQEGRRKKAANGHDTSPRPGGGKSAAGRVAALALAAWGRPVALVRGEPWAYAAGVWEPVQGELEHALRAHVHKAARMVGSTSSSTLNGALRWILEDLDLVRRGVAWDAAGVVVGADGALDLATGATVPHAQEHYATRGVGCAIDPAAACPLWLEFLESKLPARAPGTVQEWFGAALVRGKPRQLSKGLMAYGPTRSGKTQLADVARALFGGRTCGLNVRAMSERFGLQPLLHAGGWVADDAVGEGVAMDAEAYKTVVTGESISVERKGLASVEVRLDMPVLLTMNAYPTVKDSSDAVYNRTLVLPMSSEQDERASREIAKLVVAGELAGVLNWAVAGWHRLRERGYYDPPETMRAAGREFKGQNNPFADFASLCLAEAPDLMIMRHDLNTVFNAWLKSEAGGREWSGKRIGLALGGAVRGVVGEKINRGRVWVGVRFTEAALAFVEPEFGKAERTLADLNHGINHEMRERLGRPIRTKF